MTAPPRSPRLIVAIVAGIAVLVLLLVFACSHHANRYESLADDVTRALASNDMTPVAHDFNATLLPELGNRVNVARLSEMVAAHGAFKGSTEITPPASPAGFHEFHENFAEGTLDEKYELDADGKIVKFHIGPPAAQ